SPRPARASSHVIDAPRDAGPPRPAAPATPPPARVPAAPQAVDANTWPDIVAGLDLRGPVRELGASSGFVALEGDVLRLSLPESDDHLRAPFLVQQLANALGARWGAAPQIRFETGVPAGDTLHARNER